MVLISAMSVCKFNQSETGFGYAEKRLSSNAASVPTIVVVGCKKPCVKRLFGLVRVLTANSPSDHSKLLELFEITPPDEFTTVGERFCASIIRTNKSAARVKLNLIMYELFDYETFAFK